MNAEKRPDSKKRNFRPSPVRIGLWIVLAIAGGLAALQWRAKHNHQVATEKLTEIQRNVDYGVRNRLKRKDADELLNSSSGLVRGEDAVHVWRGPFSNYYVRLYISEEDELMWYDTLPPKPETNESATALIDELQQRLEPDGEDPRFDIDEWVANAVVPTPDERMPEAIEKLRRLSSQATTHPFAAGTETVIQSEYEHRRLEWYRLLLPENYQKHGNKSPKWDDLAAAFLKQAGVELSHDGTLARLYAQGRELVDLGCDDPMVVSLMLNDDRLNIYLQSKRGKAITLKQGTLDSFMRSGYPPNAAYLAAYPLFDAVDLLRLQVKELERGAEPSRDLFDVVEPIDMRLLYQHLTARHMRRGQMSPHTDFPRLLATQRPPPPWLKHMFAAAIQTDSAVVRSCLLNAWYVMPANPEAAFELFVESIRHREWAGYRETFVGEAGDFWFHQAVNGQIDYPPAYEYYIRWLEHDSRQYYRSPQYYAERWMKHGLDCLQTARFDTDVPLEFLRSAERLTRNMDPGATYSSFVRGKQYLGSPTVKENLDVLLKGYAQHPDYAQTLEHYAVCIAYLNGEFEEALARLDALSKSPDALVFDRCSVTPREIRLAAQMAKTRQTFSVGRQTAISGLTFSPDSNSLICMADEDRAYRFDLASGMSDDRFKSEIGVSPIYVEPDGSKIIGYDKKGTISQRAADTFAKLTELALPAEFAGILSSDGAQGYWCTANSVAASNALAIHFRSAKDGHVAARLATDFQNIFNIHIAADKPYVAITGLALPQPDENAAISSGVWNFETGECLLKAAPFNLFLDQVKLTQNGDVFVVSGGDVGSAVGGSAAPLYGVKTLEIDSHYVRNWYLHPARVSCILVLEQLNLLVTGCDDGVVRMFEFESGKLLTKCLGHRHGITSLAYSPDKGVLASGGNDGRILLWDVVESPEPTQVKFSLLSQPLSGVFALAVEPSTGDLLTNSRGEGGLRWHAPTNFQTHEAIPEGAEIVTSNGYFFPVWSSTQGEIERYEKILKIITDFNEGTESPIQDATPEAREVSLFTPDGKSVIHAGDMVTILDRETKTPRPWGLLRGHPGAVTGMCLSRDGRWLVTGSEEPETQLRVWELPKDTTAADATAQIVSHCRPNVYRSLQGMAIAPDGSAFLLPDGNSFVQVWDVASSKLRETLKGQAASFSPDGKWIVLDGNDFNIVIYDAQSLERHRSHPVIGGGPRFLQWSEDSQSLLYSVKGWVFEIDRDTGEDLLSKRM